FHGLEDGPRLFMCAALHGDELNGLEIIRRISAELDPGRLKGTVLLAPVVNVYGFITQSRYLPDRRDLNRSFPGSAKGSLAARLAHIFLKEIALKCTHGIDLHTAAFNRFNHPQIRADLSDPETRLCAEAFGAPVIIHSNARDGSLRDAASREGLMVLLYEGGEALRFNHDAVSIGVRGALRVMTLLGMHPGGEPMEKTEGGTIEIIRTRWVRARTSGVMRLSVTLGSHIEKGQILGTISDPFNASQNLVKAPCAGIVIGDTNNPLVHRGDAVIHVGIPAVSVEPPAAGGAPDSRVLPEKTGMS
ncbi:MAG TPA: M14 family metallopeptidase, partial [Candidatus Sumerlaeota bacterium]|nr:M14 family metallopeptidase [Candidatus Sumerlaeota bacterium]